MPKPVISRDQVRRSSVAQLWFLIAALGLGVSLGTAMPAAALIGVRSVAPKLAEGASAYLGGAGIGLVIAGAGLLLGAILRATLAMAKSLSGNSTTRAEWIIPSLCCAIGVALTTWYLWSYLHPM